MNVNKANRLVHRWATVVVAVPVIVILVTGVMLQWKKHAAWIQPPTQRGTSPELALSFDEILEAASRVDEAGIETWDDVDRLDVRPGKGVVKIRANSRWEIQVDTVTGEVLQSAYRRSDLIESIHDGSFFHDSVKLWVFFPAGIVLIVMWATGIYLFALPYIARSKRRRRARADLPQDRRGQSIS
ncbi:MAG: PepSY domain-containing protein [Planctomycetota bacterium]